MCFLIKPQRMIPIFQFLNEKFNKNKNKTKYYFPIYVPSHTLWLADAVYRLSVRQVVLEKWGKRVKYPILSIIPADICIKFHQIKR